MPNTAIVFGMSPIAPSLNLTDSYYQKGDTFWRINDAVDADNAFPGNMDRVIPDIPEKHESAYLSKSYSDHFFNTIFLIPANIDFGAVVADVKRTFFVWNAHFKSVVLETVSNTSTEGVTLQNPTPAPYTYKPFQFTQFTVTAGLGGPPSIDGNFTFEFDVVTKLLSLSGVRSEIWNLLPNWSSGYKISYEYKTEIITSRSGSEQRRALRQTARKWLEFTVQDAYDKAWRVRAIMDAWQDKSFITPELTRSVTTTSGVSSDGLYMMIDEVPAWIRPGTYLVLRNGDSHGMCIVADIDENEVRFTSAITSKWPEGTLVHPGLIGRVQEDQSVNNPTSSVVDFNFRYNVTPASEGDLNTGTPYPLYNGSEVFPKRPNWAVAPRINFQADVENLDYGRGVVENLSLRDFRRRITQATFLSRNRDEADEIEQFFHRMKGRRGTFYMPTYQPDIVPSVALSALNRFMTMSGVGLVSYYSNNPVYRHIIIRLNDGTELIRSVDDISEQDGNSVVDVGVNWPRNIELSEIMMVSWLPRWRLASDILTIEWLTDQVAQYQISIQTMKDVQV